MQPRIKEHRREKFFSGLEFYGLKWTYTAPFMPELSGCSDQIPGSFAGLHFASIFDYVCDEKQAGCVSSVMYLDCLTS